MNLNWICLITQTHQADTFLSILMDRSVGFAGDDGSIPLWVQLQFKFAGSQCRQAAPGKLFTWTPPFRVRSNLFFDLHYIIVNPFWDNRTNRRHSWAATEKPMNEFLAYRAIPALKRKWIKMVYVVFVATVRFWSQFDGDRRNTHCWKCSLQSFTNWSLYRHTHRTMWSILSYLSSICFRCMALLFAMTY